MVFTVLAIGVRSHGWVTRLDPAIASTFGTHRSYGLEMVASAIGWIGAPAAIAVLGLVAGLLLSWRFRSPLRGAVVIGTVGAAALANTIAKAVVRRPGVPRVPVQFPKLTPAQHESLAALHNLPTASRLPAEHYAFPSGHVTGTAALLGIVAVCIGVGRSRTVRIWLTCAVVAASVVVGGSRLYLRAHWFIDVLGGALLAGSCVALGAWVLLAQQRRTERSPGRQVLPDGTTLHPFPQR